MSSTSDSIGEVQFIEQPILNVEQAGNSIGVTFPTAHSSIAQR